MRSAEASRIQINRHLIFTSRSIKQICKGEMETSQTDVLGAPKHEVLTLDQGFGVRSRLADESK
jgi:hypothetical protein